jgi:hypothetical protein
VAVAEAVRLWLPAATGQHVGFPDYETSFEITKQTMDLAQKTGQRLTLAIGLKKMGFYWRAGTDSILRNVVSNT